MSRKGSKSSKSSSSTSSGPNGLRLLVVVALFILIVYYLVNSGQAPSFLDGAMTALPQVLGTQPADVTQVAAQPTPTTVRGKPSATPVRRKPTATPGAAPATGNLPFEIFFTHPGYPDKVDTRADAPIADRFVQLLNSAQTSIDIAIYEFDLPAATQALIDAKARGVNVRMVTDIDSVDSADALMTTAYSALKRAKITFVPDGRSAIMHDKFVVVDSRWVWMGSWNFTEGDTWRLNNNGALIDSPELAANYSAEFNRMFVEKHFGPSKGQGAAVTSLQINGVQAQNYFAPTDKIEPKLVDLVNTAQQSVYFLAFQFTLDDLGQAMIARSKAGVTISGVFETTGSETRFSEYGPLSKAGLDVYQDGNPYIMHEKVIIVDERTVAFGSFNFSDAAESSNDENILIVDSPALAARFVAEFNSVRDVARNAAK